VFDQAPLQFGMPTLSAGGQFWAMDIRVQVTPSKHGPLSMVGVSRSKPLGKHARRSIDISMPKATAVFSASPEPHFAHPVPRMTTTNEFYIGVSFPLGKINFKKMRPWIRLQINEATPTQTNKWRYDELHHLYWGGLLLGAGYAFHNRTLKMVGGMVAFDDAVQHVFRVESPFYLLNGELYKLKFFRQLTDYINGRM